MTFYYEGKKLCCKINAAEVRAAKEEIYKHRHFYLDVDAWKDPDLEMSIRDYFANEYEYAHGKFGGYVDKFVCTRHDVADALEDLLSPLNHDYKEQRGRLAVVRDGRTVEIVWQPY